MYKGLAFSRKCQRTCYSALIPPSIRPFRPEDRSAVLRLLWQLQDHLGALDPTQQYRRGQDFEVEYFLDFILEDNQGREGIVFVAEEEGEIIGVATGSVIVEDNERLLSHYRSKQGMLYELCVDERKRSRGIGQLLIATMEEYFASIGCTAMQLECLQTNTSAVQLYERIGFTVRNFQFVKNISLQNNAY